MGSAWQSVKVRLLVHLHFLDSTCAKVCLQSFVAVRIIWLCVWTDPDIPPEPMLPEDRLNEIRKSCHACTLG